MINDILNEADQKMDKSVEATREEFAAIRAGRANPAMFAKLTADYYGTQTPLQQLASFTVPGRADHHRGAVRHGRDGQHREGDPRLRPRRQPRQRRQDHPLRVPRADRGAAQGVHQARPHQGRGGPGRGPQPAPHRQAGPGEAGEGRRGRQGRRDRRREAARRDRPRSTPTRSTTCSSTRKPSCSRSEPDHDHHPRPVRRTTAAPAATSPPPSRPPWSCSPRSPRRLAFWKTAFMLHRRRRRRGGDLGAAAGAAGQGHRPARAAADGRRRRDGRRRLLLRRPGAGHRHRRHRAGDHAVAAAPRRRRLRPERHGVGVHPRLRAVPRHRSSRCCSPRAAPPASSRWDDGVRGHHSCSSWSPSPPTSAGTSPACCSAGTRWPR